jgi:hypothetical protein
MRFTFTLMNEADARYHFAALQRSLQRLQSE